mmetsp:Transcript_1261/g.3505  ORF Transcript_1261/g.3505 Transcript_1261/m.3505 type:complete len:651 (-) Transcript_1261:236-2188(-)
MKLGDYLQQLRSYPAEQLIQPDLKQNRQQQDKKLREDQDLASGAVLQAVVSEGEGDATPKEGDLVYVHVDVAEEEGSDPVWSTRAAAGGYGSPLAFILGKGHRAPRAWEVALLGMRKGGTCALRVRPSYGWHHPDCKLAAPPGVDTRTTLAFTLTLLGWTPADQVRPVGLNHSLAKVLLSEGGSWESARPPFEVTLHITLRALAYDGIPQTGKVLYSTTTGSTAATSGSSSTGAAGGGKPITCVMGQGSLPAGIEEALGHMCRGERSLFIIPAPEMQPAASSSAAEGPSEVGQGAGSSGGQAHACLLPPPPAKAMQVEAEVELVGLVQVRDMSGMGEVLKRRLRDGNGEFPIDCALEDTTVRYHARARRLRGGVPGPWTLDTRRPSGAHASEEQAAQEEARDADAWATPPGGEQGAPTPVELDTGCGEAPEGLEMAVKLMVPGEVARVWCAPGRYAYSDRADAPPGFAPGDGCEWEVELVGFDKEGHWQVMSFEERFALVERVKAKANELVRGGKHAYARARYERIARLMDTTRDWEDDDQVTRMAGYQVAVSLNLALCAHALGDPMAAVHHCNKALEIEPSNAKALFRRGRALAAKGDWDDAVADLEAAAQADPTIGGEVEREAAAVKARAKAAESKQKATFKNFFDRG